MSLTQLAQEIVSSIRDEGNKVSDERLMQLQLLFGPTLEHALDLVDRQRVVQAVANPSGRTCFQVSSTGKNTEIYFCFDHYCSCPSFLFTVTKGEALFCKHQLAAFLAVALNKIRRQDMDDSAYAKLLLSRPRESLSMRRF